MTGAVLVDFEAHRGHLHAVAVRILGSASDADDAVQETWLRMSRADVSEVQNPRGWLTTVTARICLDMLRARGTRREDPFDGVEVPDELPGPEDEALLADSVGGALTVILQTLPPAERLALVLHDVFGLPFAEIGAIVGRSPNATAQLASRARRRVRGRAAGAPAEQRVVEAFLAAARDGDFDALIALLHPDVALRADAAAAGGAAVSVRGAREVASRATMFAANARHADVVLVDGRISLVVVLEGVLRLVLRFAVDHGGSVAGIDIVGDAERLSRFDLRVLS